MAQLNFLLRNAKLTARRAEEARDAGVAEDLAGHVAKLTVIVKNTIPAHTDFSKLQDDSGFKELQAQHEALVRASASMKPAAATPPGSTPRRISSAAEDDARLKRYRERAQSSSGSQAKLQAKPASKGVADGADKHSSSDDDDDEVLRRHRQRQQNSQDGSKLMLRSRPTSTRSMLGAPASARASQTGGPAQKALLSAPTSFRRGATAAKKQEESDSDEEEWKRVKARAAARGSGTQVAKLANGHESDSAYSSADEWREQRSRRSTGDSFKSTKSDYNPQTSFRSQQGGATPPLSPRMKPQAELSKRRMSETNIGLKVADKSPLLSPRIAPSTGTQVSRSLLQVDSLIY
ncbi:hypothetical protein WJX72_002619 [[Myrmecia] bisecta]|uniref:Uncharacterized protein n=1 Tax=[Myrmecia] bisecta TaxID=41462 RepID=A0AAW1PFV4_9CHLO